MKTAFLYADIAEKIYVEPPRDLRRILQRILSKAVGVDRAIVHRELLNLEGGGKLLLNKSLYGLKQSPKNWHSTIDVFLKKIGLRATKSDPCLYYFVERGELLLLLLYVDDILLAATTNELRDRYYQFISEEYTVKMKPTLDKYLKVELVHHKEEQLVTMSLSGYIRDMAEKFNITPKPHITTPMIPNTALKTASMVQETAAERDYVRKFP